MLVPQFTRSITPLFMNNTFRILNVFTPTNVSEISDRVIVFVSIDMVDFMARRTRSNKCVCNKTMDSVVLASYGDTQIFVIPSKCPVWFTGEYEYCTVLSA